MWAPLSKSGLGLIIAGVSLVSCTGSTKLPMTEAAQICNRYAGGSVLTVMSEIKSYASFGPASSAPGPLDGYAPEEQIALCLIPVESGESSGESIPRYKVVAVTLPDHQVHALWVQNTKTAFNVPS